MKSLRILIDKLMSGALWESCASGDGRHVERMRKHGGYANLPDRYKPGRVIMGLSEEDRETLKRATSKDFNHRTFEEQARG
jgi:hypothetical protein